MTDMSYVSAHARVLDGVRAARVRAYDESLRPPHLGAEPCIFHDVPSVALWVHAISGVISPLCAEHLEGSLTTFRREDDGPPPAIVPVRRRTA